MNRQTKTTITTYRNHRDGCVAVIRTDDAMVSVWVDGTVTRTAVTDDGRCDEIDITSAALAGEVEI
jgi:hypothetical protein